MSEPNSAPEPKKRNVSIWIKIFVPLHLIAITSWSLPDAPAQYTGNPPTVRLGIKTDNPVAFFSSTSEYLRNELLIGNRNYVKNSPLALYLLGTGFWQYWDMFAPNPASVDVYADAVIHYRDGQEKTYQYPRMFTLSLGQKFLKERWRKFFERAGNDQYRYLWPVFAQRIALINYDDPQNPPVLVDLHRHEMVINPPGEPQNKAYSDTRYFSWYVNQDELKKDKGL